MTTKTGFTVAMLAVAAIALPALEAEAKITTKKSQGGVEAVWGSTFDNQLNGEPIVEFPLGCRPGACHYTIWLVFLAAASDPDNCVDDPTTRWSDCDASDQCIVWVEFGERVLPLTDFHGRFPTLSDIATNQVIMSTRDVVSGERDTAPVFDGNENYHGRNFAALRVLGGKVDIYESGRCRAALAALFIRNINTFFDEGGTVPLEILQP